MYTVTHIHTLTHILLLNKGIRSLIQEILMLSSLVDRICRTDWIARWIRELLFLMVLSMVEKSIKDI